MPLLLILLLWTAAARAEVTQDPRELGKAATQLHTQVNAACGGCIVGVGIGDLSDKATWRLDYADGVDAAQKKQAEDAVRAFQYQP